MSRHHVGCFLVLEPDATIGAMLAALCRRIRRTQWVRTWHQALEALSRRPHLTGFILEPEAPGCGSVGELLAQLRAPYPMLPALLLTSNTSSEAINQAHCHRVEFHAKPAQLSGLCSFTRRAVAFERIPDQRIAWLVDTAVAQFGLSPRETDLLVAAIAGVPRQVVCDQLGTTGNTLKSVAKSALRKLPHSSLDEAAREILRYALEGSHVTTNGGLFPTEATPNAVSGVSDLALESDVPTSAPRHVPARAIPIRKRSESLPDNRHLAHDMVADGTRKRL